MTIRGVTIRSVTIRSVTIRGVTISGVTIRGVTIRGVTIRGVTTRGVTISGVTIRGMTVRGVTIRGVTIRGVTIRGVTIRNVTSKGVASILFRIYFLACMIPWYFAPQFHMVHPNCIQVFLLVVFVSGNYIAIPSLRLEMWVSCVWCHKFFSASSVPFLCFPKPFCLHLRPIAA